MSLLSCTGNKFLKFLKVFFLLFCICLLPLIVNKDVYIKPKTQLPPRWSAYVRRPASDLRSRRENDCPEVTMLTLLSNAAINARIRYNTAQVNNGCRRKLCVEIIVAKPLEIATWLLMTVYRNSSSPYPTALSLSL